MAQIQYKLKQNEDGEKYSLLAIRTIDSDARMAWLLNSVLQVDFVNQEDLFGQEVDGVRRPFAVFTATDEFRQTNYSLITNRQESEVLIKAYPNIDYVLKFSCEVDTEELLAIRNAIRALPGVTACLDVSSDKRLVANL